MTTDGKVLVKGLGLEKAKSHDEMKIMVINAFKEAYAKYPYDIASATRGNDNQNTLLVC